jgi:predicted nucleic acid-binding protein
MVTMADNNVFLDTNILVYAAVTTSPYHTKARQIIHQYQTSSAKLWISCQIIREYLVTLSRPQVYTKPLSISALASDVDYFLNNFHVTEDNCAITKKLLELAQKIPTAGKQLHDANIVATMLVHGISTLVTCNITDFKRYSKLIRIIDLQTD